MMQLLILSLVLLVQLNIAYAAENFDLIEAIIHNQYTPVSNLFAHTKPDSSGKITRAVYSLSSINSPGSYRLYANVSNQITINSSNVTLDCNGHTINGGSNGISIATGLSNITIKNGTIRDVTNSGITATNCTELTLANMTCKNCIRGILFDQILRSSILNCDMITNTTGAEISNSADIVIENCNAFANTQAGFSLVSTLTCSVQKCTAFGTGDGNANSSGDNSYIYGYVTFDGFGNIFENCLAQSTQGLSVTDFNSIVTGFGIRGSGARGNKIINCTSGNSMTSPSGQAVPYGIWLEESMSQLNLLYSVNTGFVGGSVAWSPDGRFFAFCATDPANPDINIYRYDYETGTPTLVQSLTLPVTVVAVSSCAWSPDGVTIALSQQVFSGNSISIYEFDPISYSLTLRDVATQGNNRQSICANWTYDGLYLATGGDRNTVDGVTHKVFRFDPVSKTITEVATGDRAAQCELVSWSPDGNYLTVGGSEIGGSSIEVERFDRNTNTLTPIASNNAHTGLAEPVNSGKWTPDGKYIIYAGNNGVVVLRFENETLTQLISETGLGTLEGMDISSDGRYISTGGNGNVIRIYYFDRSANTLNLIDTDSIGDTVTGSAWSPDGSALIVASANTQVTPISMTIYQGLSGPTDNLIQANSIYCNSGNINSLSIGISGSSVKNQIIQNSSFENLLNYAYVANVFNPLFEDAPTNLQNISTKVINPIPGRIDTPADLWRIELLSESLVENLL